MDSSKDIKYLRKLYPFREKVLIIHIIRDGRGVLYSLLKRYKRLQLPFYTYWGIGNLKIEFIKHLYPNHLTITYGYFCKVPRYTLYKIFKYLQLKNKKISLIYNKERHHIEGNPIRFIKIENIIESIEWKRELSFSNKLIFYILWWWLIFYYKIKYGRGNI